MILQFETILSVPEDKLTYLFGSQLTGKADERIEPLPFNLKTFTADDLPVRQILHTGQPL